MNGMHPLIYVCYCNRVFRVLVNLMCRFNMPVDPITCMHMARNLSGLKFTWINHEC